MLIAAPCTLDGESALRILHAYCHNKLAGSKHGCELTCSCASVHALMSLQWPAIICAVIGRAAHAEVDKAVHDLALVPRRAGSKHSGLEMCKLGWHGPACQARKGFCNTTPAFANHLRKDCGCASAVCDTGLPECCRRVSCSHMLTCADLG